MKRTLITIEQMEYDDGSHEINIYGNVDGYAKFVEKFNTSEQPPIKLAIGQKEIDSYKTADSATPNLLLRIFNLLIRSKKTDGGLISERDNNLKFSMTALFTIRAFEKIAKIKFDYSKFNNLTLFQQYFKSLLKL